MRARWEWFCQLSVVAHLIRAVRRYFSRNGAQFAAGIAYYSVVAVVPVCMLAFSILGMTLTVIQPAWLANIESTIRSILAQQPELTAQILDAITKALHSWTAVGVTGLVVALWIGSAWMGNLKRAFRVLLRPKLGEPEPKLPFWLEIPVNLGILVLLFLGVLATFFASAVTLSLSGQLGIPRVFSVITSVVVGFGLFLMILRLFSVEKLPFWHLAQGSIIGAVGLGVLQLMTTWIIQIFSNNVSAATFGSVIVLMIFMNLFASLILLVAAWVGTCRVTPDVDEAADLEPEWVSPVDVPDDSGGIPTVRPN
ncbi:MAG: YihY/virulence factor BrkB family protein [Propionibacteriaceae bacterium]|jgi:membrane protein|nr:YihY/virulence factor BrkB family protein [Propionibacteriaceae bacterium]